MARAARGLGGELRSQIDEAAEAPLVAGAGRGPRGRPRGPRDRAVHVGGDPGRTRDWPVTPTGAAARRALGLVVAVVLGYLIYRGAIRST